MYTYVHVHYGCLRKVTRMTATGQSLRPILALKVTQVPGELSQASIHTRWPTSSRKGEPLSFSALPGCLSDGLDRFSP